MTDSVARRNQLVTVVMVFAVFTGFAFGRGWLSPPPVRRWLVVLAIAIVALSLPLEYYRVLRAVPEMAEARRALIDIGLIGKTPFAILRYVHFLAIGYLAWVAVGEGGRRLQQAGILQPVVERSAWWVRSPWRCS